MLKRINHNSHTIPFIKVIQLIFLKVITTQAHNHILNQGKLQGQPPSRPASRSGSRISPRREWPSLRWASLA